MTFEYKSLGFVGLGAMGKPMASHLAEKLPKSCKMWVYDVIEEPVDEFCRQYPDRATKASSAKEVAENCVIIFTMVPEGSHVKSAYLDPLTGICAAPLTHTLLIDCSTIDTATSQIVAQHIASVSPTSSFYDAPVSGGVAGAEKASLAIFLGCAEDDTQLPRLMHLLSMFGKQIIPCGAPSLGLAAKLSNNYLSGIIAIAASEAFSMGMRSGLDPRVLARVYSAGTAQNTICDRFCPVPGVQGDAPSDRGYEGGFKVQLMKKDFGLACDMAERVGARNVLGEAGLKVYEGASEDERCRGLDSRVVYRYLGGEEKWRKD